MQPSTIKTRCFCHHSSNYPSISIKTQKAANTWAVIDENTNERDGYRILNCGHALHERCAKLMARLNQEFHESITCPMCQVDWTRPSELSALQTIESQNTNIGYNACVCDEKVRVYKNQKNEWTPSTLSMKAYPCGHGCHIKCHQLFWKILKKQSEDCPICQPSLQPTKVVDLTHERALFTEQLNQQKILLENFKERKALENKEWNQKRHSITAAVLVLSCVIFRFGHLITDIRTPIPLTKFSLGDLIICITTIALSIFIYRTLALPVN